MSSPSRTQLIGGHFQDAEGNVLDLGRLIMELTGDEQLSSSTGQVCGGIKVTILLDTNGSAQGTSGDSDPMQYVWPTDVMAPSGASYTVWAYTAEGQLAWGPNYGLLVPSGATFDLDTWIPNQVGSGGGNASGLTLQTNGVNNDTQSLLDIQEGTNVTITESAGVVTISAAGGAYPAALPYSVRGAVSSNSQASNQLGATKIALYILDVTNAVTFSKLALGILSGDDGSILQDVGIYSLAGALIANIGAKTGVTGTNDAYSANTLQGSQTLPAGRYLVGVTGSTNGTGFSFATFVPQTLSVSYSTANTSSAGVLPASITVVVGAFRYVPDSYPFNDPCIIITLE